MRHGRGSVESHDDGGRGGDSGQEQAPLVWLRNCRRVRPVRHHPADRTGSRRGVLPHGCAIESHSNHGFTCLWR